MLCPRILNRYILREILSPFFIALFVFTGILFLARILQMVDLVINKNIPLSDTLLLFSYVIPRFLEFALPMSLLIAVISTFGRFSADSELVVMRSCGISFQRLAVPVFSFALATLVLTLAVSLWIMPWANYQLGVGLFEIAKRQASAGLLPGVFNDLGRLTIYAENIDGNGSRMTNVILADNRDSGKSVNFLAKHGQIITDDQKRTISLRLYDGSIHRGAGLNYNVTYFDINNIKLSERELLEDDPARKGKKSGEMFLGELTTSINSLKERPDPQSYEDLQQLAAFKVEWHKRLVIPVACIFIAFVAMALGIQPSRSGETWGATANTSVGFLVIFLYWILLAFSEALAKKAIEPIWLLMWLPNITFALLAYYLFRVMQQEKWLAATQSLGHLFGVVAQKLRVVKAVETEFSVHAISKNQTSLSTKRESR